MRGRNFEFAEVTSLTTEQFRAFDFGFIVDRITSRMCRYFWYNTRVYLDDFKLSLLFHEHWVLSRHSLWANNVIASNLSANQNHANCRLPWQVCWLFCTLRRLFPLRHICIQLHKSCFNGWLWLNMYMHLYCTFNLITLYWILTSCRGDA